jgi:hypothetical protein
MAEGFNSANAKEGAAMKKAICLGMILTLLTLGQSIVLPEKALAITIKEEQDLSKEFLKVIFFALRDDPGYDHRQLREPDRPKDSVRC